MRLAAVVALLVLAATMLAVWFFRTHERVVVEQPAVLTGEARVNDFLAAEMTLSKLGIETDSRFSLTPSDWLPDTFDTLVVRASPAFSAPDERSVLSTWVADGGHLVLLAPEQQTQAADEMLEYFGFQIADAEFPAEPYVAERMLVPEQGAGRDNAGYTVDRINVRQRLVLTGTAIGSSTLYDEYGFVAARRVWGGGFITLIAGSTPFDNLFLAESDHARLLLDAVAGYVEPGKVWFIYDESFPPLWRLIWDNAPYLVGAVVLATLVWLWSAIFRFGPVVTPAAPVRRSIIEHVRAAAQMVWRYRGASVLARGSLDAVVRRAASRHPEIQRLAPNEQAALIANLTGRPVEKVLAVLEIPAEIGHREFTQRIHTLQSMRNEL